MKGLRQILIINSSKTEYFEESVKGAATALRISDSKKELLKLKNDDPIKLSRRKKLSETTG